MNLIHKSWPIAKLIEYEKNPRQNDHAVDQIAAAIEYFGFRIPIVAKSDGTIVDGHLRLKAARKLGMSKVPVVLADDMTDEQIKAFRISVNKMAELADWDEDLLRAELLDLQGIEFDIDLLGFDMETLEDLLFIEPERDDSKEDEVPEPPVDPVSKLGDVWLLGKHRVMCGDSTKIEDVKKLMNGQKADMVFTDPPYGIGVVKNNSVGGGGGKRGPRNNKESSSVEVRNKTFGTTYFVPVIGDNSINTAKKAIQIIKTLGAKVEIIFGGNYFANQLDNSSCWIVWDKQNTGNFADAELAWTNQKSATRIFRHLWNGFIRASEVNQKRVHPTQKPIALVEWCVEQYGGDCKSIMDLFGGSGSTLIGCEKTGRICYMMEISPAYVDVIVNRWQTYANQQAIHEATGQTFDACRDVPLWAPFTEPGEPNNAPLINRAPIKDAPTDNPNG